MTEAEEERIRSDERARILGLVQARVERFVDLGRARDAERWRAFREWLRGSTKEKGRQITPPAPFAPYVNTQADDIGFRWPRL